MSKYGLFDNFTYDFIRVTAPIISYYISLIKPGSINSVIYLIINGNLMLPVN